MKIHERLAAWLGYEKKASAVGGTIAGWGAGAPKWTTDDYLALAQQGYQRNVIAYACVRMVAQAVGSIEPLVYTRDGRDEIPGHPALSLLAAPNETDDWSTFAEALASHYLMQGNAYAEAVEGGGAPQFLYSWRPDRVRVIKDQLNIPLAYEYQGPFGIKRLEARKVLHLRAFHPTDDHYGFSPLRAAARSIDQHNSSADWMVAMLQNGARPSGLLRYMGNKDGDHFLPEEQRARIETLLRERYAGASNAGKIMTLPGFLEYQALGLDAVDMQALETRYAMAREICLAFGVPPMLLGIPGDNTYSNFREANAAFTRGPVLQMANRLMRQLTRWLAQWYGPDLKLSCDEDKIAGLAYEREQLWDRVEKSTALTTNEKREALGYEARPEGDAILVNASMVELGAAPNVDELAPVEPDAAPDAPALRRIA